MVDERLGRAIGSSELPVGLIELESFALLTLSRSAAALLGAPLDDLIGMSVLELTEQPEATRDALETMARGSIDAYEARRQLRRSDGSTSDVRLWVRDLGAQGHSGMALMLLIPDPGTLGEEELARIAPALPEVTVGTVDESGAFDRLSPEVQDLLGYASVDLDGELLLDSVHPDDVGRFRSAASRSLADRCGVGVTVRLANQTQGWEDVRMVLSPSDDEASRRLGFSITDDIRTLEPSTGAPGRESTPMPELERGLARIANEIQALRVAVGVADLPAGEALPELADLSSRQWEVVTRLLDGQRPPAIAKAMYVSQSTIRNHLTAVFRKLGVHSQQELIDRLRDRTDGSPSPA